MRTPEQWCHYKELELISSPGLDLKAIRLMALAAIRKGWRTCQSFLTLRDEPQVWQFQQEGKICWKIYAPKTDQIIEFKTEQDVVMWLEERHHSHNSNWNTQEWW